METGGGMQYLTCHIELEFVVVFCYVLTAEPLFVLVC